MALTTTRPATGRRFSLGAIRRHPAPAVGIVAATVSTIGSWSPSFWGDEAATVLSAQRPLDSLWPMLARVDAVHGMYYLFMHLWIGAFGASEFSVRLPSAIAVGLAAAGIVVLVSAFASGRIAVTAGLIFAIIPRVTLMGAEGRSYAIGTVLAVWTTTLLVSAAQSDRHRRTMWAVYVVAMALCIWLFMFLGLLLVVHAVWMLGSASNRAHVRSWAQSAAVAVVLASPLLILGYNERKQVAFIATRAPVTPERVLVDQWFWSPWVALIGWVLVVFGVVRVVRGHSESTLAPLLKIALPWLVLPTVLLVAVNAFVSPAYSNRYLSFCTPALAILLAVGLTALPSRLGAIAALALLIAVAPAYMTQRGPFGKDGGSDLRQSAAFVGAHASTGDAVVFDASTRPSRRPRLALHLYPADFAGLRDVLIGTPYDRSSRLWDTTVPLGERSTEIQESATVWLVELRGSPAFTSESELVEIQNLGYRVALQHTIHRTVVYELVRNG